MAGTAEANSGFDDFYGAQYMRAVRLAMALVGRWAVAEELAQDAFLALFAHWDRVSSYESPEAWIRRVVVNRSVSHVRRRAVETRLLLRLGNERGRDVELPDRDLELWRRVAALRRARRRRGCVHDGLRTEGQRRRVEGVLPHTATNLLAPGASLNLTDTLSAVTAASITCGIALGGNIGDGNADLAPFRAVLPVVDAVATTTTATTAATSAATPSSTRAAG